MAAEFLNLGIPPAHFRWARDARWGFLKARLVRSPARHDSYEDRAALEEALKVADRWTWNIVVVGLAIAGLAVAGLLVNYLERSSAHSVLVAPLVLTGLSGGAVVFIGLWLCDYKDDNSPPGNPKAQRVYEARTIAIERVRATEPDELWTYWLSKRTIIIVPRSALRAHRRASKTRGASGEPGRPT